MNVYKLVPSVVPELIFKIKLLVTCAAVPVVLPVPPLAIPRIPLTPGVIFAVPLKLAVEVEARFTLTVLAVFNLVAEATLSVTRAS